LNLDENREKPNRNILEILEDKQEMNQRSNERKIMRRNIKC
jgi:hypothetical protein